MKKLTDKELAIMNVLWDNGALSMRDILARLPEPQPNFNTLTTIVRRLEISGMIKHQRKCSNNYNKVDQNQVKYLAFNTTYYQTSEFMHIQPSFSNFMQSIR